jgi:hypothetical protein
VVELNSWQMQEITASVTGILFVTFVTVLSVFLVTGITYPHYADAEIAKDQNEIIQFFVFMPIMLMSPRKQVPWKTRMTAFEASFGSLPTLLGSIPRLYAMFNSKSSMMRSQHRYTATCFM